MNGETVVLKTGLGDFAYHDSLFERLAEKIAADFGIELSDKVIAQNEQCGPSWSHIEEAIGSAYHFLREGSNEDASICYKVSTDKVKTDTHGRKSIQSDISPKEYEARKHTVWIKNGERQVALSKYKGNFYPIFFSYDNHLARTLEDMPSDYDIAAKPPVQQLPIRPDSSNYLNLDDPEILDQITVVSLQAGFYVIYDQLTAPAQPAPKQKEPLPEPVQVDWSIFTDNQIPGEDDPIDYVPAKRA